MLSLKSKPIHTTNQSQGEHIHQLQFRLTSILNSDLTKYIHQGPYKSAPLSITSSNSTIHLKFKNSTNPNKLKHSMEIKEVKHHKINYQNRNPTRTSSKASKNRNYVGEKPHSTIPLQKSR